MIIHTNKAIYKISLREYKNGFGYLSPDYFDEVENLSGWDTWKDEDDNLCMNDDDINAVIDWWEDEVNYVNNGDDDGEVLCILGDGFYMFRVENELLP